MYYRSRESEPLYIVFQWGVNWNFVRKNFRLIKWLEYNATPQTFAENRSLKTSRYTWVCTVHLFLHLHLFWHLHFLGPFHNLNKLFFSCTKAATSSFHHQVSLCLEIPYTLTASLSMHSFKSFHMSSASLGLPTDIATLACTLCLKIPSVTASYFHTLHLFINFTLELTSFSFKSKTQISSLCCLMHSSCTTLTSLTSFLSLFLIKKKSITVLQALVSYKSSYSFLYISSLPPPPFYRPTPNHPHSYAPDAQTTSVCHASRHPPHSVYPKDCTNPHCTFYPSTTLHTSISQSFTLRTAGTTPTGYLGSMGFHVLGSLCVRTGSVWVSGGLLSPGKSRRDSSGSEFIPECDWLKTEYA